MVPAALVAALTFAQTTPLPAAPPPMDPTAQAMPMPSAEAGTVAKLDTAEKEDSGRNFELFYLDGSLGASYLDMRQFASSSLALEKTSAAGPAFSLGAGIRLVVLTLGVRARYNALTAFNMWQLDGEVGLKFPISKFDLLIGLHGGYSFVGRLGDASVGNTTTPTNADNITVHGFNAGLDVALDYYVSPYVSVGIGALADFLYLTRPPVATPSGLTADQQAAVANDPLYQQSGTTAGLQLGVGLRLGAHFGL